MYLLINGNRHTCTRRIVTADTIKYLSVSPAPEEIAGKIQMFRDDGFLLSEDDVSSYARTKYAGTLLTLTNKAESTAAPKPSLEVRVAAIESAIKRGLSL